jgi:hypothetical protein
LRTDLVNHGFLRGHPVFAVCIFPKTAVMVIGVQNGEMIGFVFDWGGLGSIHTQGNKGAGEQNSDLWLFHNSFLKVGQK